MIFRETPIRGAFVVEPERLEDVRGFFARLYCREEFERRGLVSGFAQDSVSFNQRRFTLRGMHFQRAPHAETKLVRCTAGRVHDVLLDLRPGAGFGAWWAVELSAANRWTLYVPEGVAHGFLTLEDGCELFYRISVPYRPEAAAGVRWNDPAFGIHWPCDRPILSERDRDFPDFCMEVSSD